MSEGLAASVRDITDIAVAEVDNGWVVRAALTGLGIDKLTERVRTRVAESSCGLCGIENLAAVARPLPWLPPTAPSNPPRSLPRWPPWSRSSRWRAKPARPTPPPG
ncbi:hypothetical protein [Novosphingobium sp.]|uniref:hypothetical protein n=1 Tax=Novosphingobium sp. TaxID=1874826 RepID=UPI0025EEB58D|nr:hypothetical protein [Novosphingobium sp.]